AALHEPGSVGLTTELVSGSTPVREAIGGQ
ncbi:NAD-dependent dehydratase, partial [Deinococcus sp. 6GRE01]|nr:NAD-dependent dehydratase [Deinococcus sp. 6GRE01]